MKKLLLAAVLAAPLLLASCASLIRTFTLDYSVPVKEPLADIKARQKKIMDEKSYLKKFTAVDKSNKKHEVVILDKKYMTIDGVAFAYQFSNLMAYGPGLGIGNRNSFKLPDKKWGLQGYASAAANPETTLSFIFAKKLFGQRGYSSMREACEINGVSFYGPQVDEGYIDDFGQWRQYGYYDYFEDVFGSRSQDTRTEMYMALELRQKLF